MSTKIYQMLGVPKKDADLGVEVEVELVKPHQSCRGWMDKEDHSLRGFSREYVTPPVTYGEAALLIKALRKQLSSDGQKILYSYRAGVHVHLNMLDMTLEQVHKLVMLYYILEIPLINFCGDDRVGNSFCLRGIDAEGGINQFKKALKEGSIYVLENDAVRYAALNFKALVSYGTLEFRSLSTFEDLAKLDEWITILRNLKEKSLEYLTPQDILEDFSAKGAEDFCKHLLGENFNTVFDGKFSASDIYEGLNLAQEIAFFNIL